MDPNIYKYKYTFDKNKKTIDTRKRKRSAGLKEVAKETISAALQDPRCLSNDREYDAEAEGAKTRERTNERTNEKKRKEKNELNRLLSQGTDQ